MSMVVQHNLSAMNTNRQLGITTGQLSKSTEKLSSGYRINRAGDDAAGLTISEKMRSQIRGIDQASTNAEDGISLIQSAEGALNETHSILQRMNELAVQGANDTNEDIDREAINKELEALSIEIDRISTTTQFNKKNLLDGTLQDSKLQVGANVGQNIVIDIDNMSADAIGLKTTTYTTYAFSVNGIQKEGYATQSAASAAAKNLVYEQHTASVTTSDGKYFLGTASYHTVESAKSAVFAANSVGVAACTKSARVAVDNFTVANQTLSKVQVAINKVSEQRSSLGALQNRLEHTIANLDTTSENTSAAESRIRDVDMAEEMVEYSKSNILSQAGQAMLAQANQSTQGVLSLLG